MRFITLLALVVTLFPVKIHADISLSKPKHAYFLLVCGHNVNCDRAEVIFRESAKIFKRDLNVTLVIKARLRIQQDMLGSPEERLNKWIAITAQYVSKFRVDGTFVFVDAFPATSPHIQFESESVLGAASGLGVIGTCPSLAFARMIGSDRSISRIVMHEVGHLFGATHTNSGLMASSAQEVDLCDSFSYESLEQMKYFISMLP